MAAEVTEAEEVVGATLAHAAAFTGDTRALVALSGQDPVLLRAKTEDGETPAHHAAAAGVVASLECLGEIDVTLLAEADVEGWCVGLLPVCASCLLYACASLTGLRSVVYQDTGAHGCILWPAGSLAGESSSEMH